MLKQLQQMDENQEVQTEEGQQEQDIASELENLDLGACPLYCDFEDHLTDEDAPR